MYFFTRCKVYCESYARHVKVLVRASFLNIIVLRRRKYFGFLDDLTGRNFTELGFFKDIRRECNGLLQIDYIFVFDISWSNLLPDTNKFRFSVHNFAGGGDGICGGESRERMRKEEREWKRSRRGSRDEGKSAER